MKYRHKFVEKVRGEFPDCEKLEQLLEEGSVCLGRYLETKAVLTLDPGEVVSAFRTGQERWIQEKAEKALRVQSLYDEWQKQYERAIKKGKEHPIEIYYM